MTDHTITPKMLGTAAATGAAGAAFSVTRHPRTTRAIGVAVSAGVGGVVAYQARQGVPVGEGGEPASSPVSLPRALGIGAGVFAVAAAVSEVGLRAQARAERWAERTTGRPRLVIGVATGLLSLGLDVLDRRIVLSDEVPSAADG